MSEQAVTRVEVVAALRSWRPGAAEVVALCGIDPARRRFPDDAIERAAALWRVLGDARRRDPDVPSGGLWATQEPQTGRVLPRVYPRPKNADLVTRGE